MKKALLVLMLVLLSVSSLAVYKNTTEKSPVPQTDQEIKDSVTRVAAVIVEEEPVTVEEAVKIEEEAVQAAEEIEVPEEVPAVVIVEAEPVTVEEEPVTVEEEPVTVEEAVEIEEEAVQAAEEIEVPEEVPAVVINEEKPVTVEEAVEIEEEAVQAAEEIEVPDEEPAAVIVEEEPVTVEEAVEIEEEALQEALEREEALRKALEREKALREAEEREALEKELAAVIEEGREIIVVLPFDNLSRETNALNMIMPEIRQRLKDRGLYVIDEDVLSDFLCDRKVRAAGYISKNIMQEVGGKLKAKTILAGSVVSFSSKGTPQVGILARLIDSSTGVILWADYASVSGDDSSVFFGLGMINNIEEVVPKALDKLFTSFSTDISKKNTESVKRIAVMPFKNRSDSRDAGMIVTYMFLVELLKDPAYEPVEYGEIRRLCVELRIRSKGDLEFKNIKALSEALGTYWILLGSVDDYAYGTNASSVPKVGLTARLLDAHENRIIWYNSLQLSGEEDIIAFDWGSVRQVDKLAYKAVSELVEKIGK